MGLLPCELARQVFHKVNPLGKYTRANASKKISHINI
jgi:hypothetical protein